MLGTWIDIPYSSTKVLFNEQNFGAAFHEVDEPVVARQKRISQLQGLTHPLLSECKHEHQGCFWFTFPHTRFDHAIRVSLNDRSVLKKAGFSERYVQQFGLIGLTHDAPTPAWGDATMRLNKEKLCEVKNYKRFMIETGLGKKWQQLYDFDVDEAAGIVAGEGVGGMLHKIKDWQSYISLDVFYLGKNKPAEIQRLLKNHPLILDFSRDIEIVGGQLFFSNANRLFRFLKLRALMSCELYFNPDCRKLEHLSFSEMKKMFESGKISLDDLRYKDDKWLDSVVRAGKHPAWCTQPRELAWTKFESEREADIFCENNERVYHKEFIKPFKTGMNLLALHKGKIMPLHDALPKRLVNELENLSHFREGWYVYYHK